MVEGLHQLLLPALLLGDSRRWAHLGLLQSLHTLLLLSLQWVKVEESLGKRLSIQCGACLDWYGEGIGEPGEPTMRVGWHELGPLVSCLPLTGGA